jgi:hypothetical protein
LGGAAVLSAVTRPANWQALRRRLRPCLIATAGMTLFLGVWQFLVPGGDTASAPSVTVWAMIVTLWALLPNAVVLASSASRSLWGERHRAAAFFPIPGLLACAVGLPVLVELVGVGRIAALWAFPAGLLISASTSVAVILRLPVVIGAAREPDDADESHAYARDVVQRSSKGDS